MTAESDISLRPAYSKLLWMANILTLDSPADVRRYKLPPGSLTEAEIRALMAVRVEFSKGAVAKVKIDAISFNESDEPVTINHR